MAKLMARLTMVADTTARVTMAGTWYVVDLISWPRTRTTSFPKIDAKRKRKMTGRATVKNTAAGSRQNCFWS
jgi:hypothetical protein